MYIFNKHYHLLQLYIICKTEKTQTFLMCLNIPTGSHISGSHTTNVYLWEWGDWFKGGKRRKAMFFQEVSIGTHGKYMNFFL